MSSGAVLRAAHVGKADGLWYPHEPDRGRSETLMNHTTIAFIAALAVGLTLLASGVGKLRDPGGFVLGVLEYRVLPTRLAILYGRILPFAEAACAVALLVGLWPRGVGVATALLLASFLVAVVINLARGRTLDCHCFGAQQSEPLGWLTLFRLFVLLGCALITVIWRGAALLVPPPHDVLPDALIAVAITICIYLLVAAIPGLWRTWRTKAVYGRPASGGRVSLRRIPLPNTPSEPSQG